MDRTKSRQPYHTRHRPVVLAPQTARRIDRHATRSRPKRTALEAPQDVRSSSRGGYPRPVDRTRQGRMISVRDHVYDRQPQLVATPEDEEDDEMVYPDEEPSFDEEFGDAQDAQDAQDDKHDALEALIHQQSEVILAFMKKLEAKLVESTNQLRAEFFQSLKQLRAEFSEHMKQMRKENSENLKQIRTDNNQMPHRFGDIISTMATGQHNVPIQGSTSRDAPFQMGLDSTVNPSNLTSNTRGSENNGL